ncbi:hypothetical protein [uncultured Kordia sp.]|uniref:hypothetical protein n=1 Tax=uncultured Kordia sp. TaxID=507699 RepID=UPI00260D0E0F|nr:hypothetical protein [uncultured Kordia sp.]
MKKQIKTLQLQKQTISALRANLLHGGAPTTMSVNTFASGCQSQLPCQPVPQDPRPIEDTSRVLPCTTDDWNKN